MNIRYIRNKSKKNRNENSKKIKFYTIPLLCLIFGIGILLGTIYFQTALDENFLDESKNILENLELNLSENVTFDKLFTESFSKNIIMIIFIWIIGLSILGVPILIFYILYDGFSLGVTLSYILITFGFYDGYSYLFSNIYIVTTINTIILFLLCTSAIKVTINILKQRSNLKNEFVRHSIVCIIMIAFCLFSSVMEAQFNICY